VVLRFSVAVEVAGRFEVAYVLPAVNALHAFHVIAAIVTRIGRPTTRTIEAAFKLVRRVPGFKWQRQKRLAKILIHLLIARVG